MTSLAFLVAPKCTCAHRVCFSAACRQATANARAGSPAKAEIRRLSPFTFQLRDVLYRASERRKYAYVVDLPGTGSRKKGIAAFIAAVAASSLHAWGSQQQATLLCLSLTEPDRAKVI